MTAALMSPGCASARSASPSSRTTWSTWPTQPRGRRSPGPGWSAAPPHDQGFSTSTATRGTPPWPNTGGGERPGWQTWKPTLTLRIAGVLVTGLSTGLLTAAVADTLAWRRGAQGERRTARLLAPLERYGYQVFHDLGHPRLGRQRRPPGRRPHRGLRDRLQRYRGHLHYSAGRLWHGRRALDHTLDTLWWEATQVAETLGFGPDLHVYPVLCVHVARLPWQRELLVDGIPVLAAGTLRPALRVIRQALSPEQVELVAAQVRSGFQPAA